MLCKQKQKKTGKFQVNTPQWTNSETANYLTVANCDVS